MAIEIERKFLVCSTSYRKEAISEKRIVQGFLNTHPERTVRIRVMGDEAYITVKGKSNVAGTSRFEWEQSISIAAAEALLQLCEKGVIEKIRFEVPVGNHIFEIDEFSRENTGLVVAEIELAEEDEHFVKPTWLGEEVTGDIRYYNSNLSKNPFQTWN